MNTLYTGVRVGRGIKMVCISKGITMWNADTILRNVIRVFVTIATPFQYLLLHNGTKVVITDLYKSFHYLCKTNDK